MPNARAVKFRGAGGVEVIELGELAVRDPGAGEILVEVRAAALNRADILQRRGFYPAPPGAPADVPGLEYAGVVAAVGEGVTAWSAGDPVMGIVGGGGMATYVVVSEREAIAVPPGMALEDAAAIPEVFLTAYDALVSQAGLGLGDWVLIHAAGSGVGTAAVQLASAAGAHPLGTSRTAAKLERCADYGLRESILAEGGKFAGAIDRVTGGHGVDIILDGIGAAYLEENLRALARSGTLVVIGLLGGVSGTLLLGPLLAKRARVIGTVLRSRSLEEKATVAQAFARHALPLFASGALRPVVDCVLPMADVAAAHQRMEANDSFGKIVLRWE